MAAMLSVSEKKNCFALILAAFQGNSSVSLRILVPYKGNSGLRIDPYYRSFSIFFNLHYTNAQGKLTSLRQTRYFEDHIRVFFSVEDFQAWTQVIPESTSNFATLDVMKTHLEELRGSGEFIKAFQLSIFIAQLQDNDIEALKTLRMFETPIDVLYEVSTLCRVACEALTLKQASERKVVTDFLVTSFHYFRYYLEKTVLIERNVFLEPIQSRLVNVVTEVERFVESGNYDWASKYLRWVQQSLRGMCAEALAVCELAIVLVFEA